MLSMTHRQHTPEPGNTQYRSVLLATAATTEDEYQASALKTLLAAGANIHDWDADGNTCLHLTLAAARPWQPWVVCSLAILIRAGADPSQANHRGLSVFDIACRPSRGFGTFRRDALLQALIESGGDILDERVLAPTRLSTSYTSWHHALICGAFELRTALINRFTSDTNRQTPISSSRLYQTAVGPRAIFLSCDRSNKLRSCVSESTRISPPNVGRSTATRHHDERSPSVSILFCFEPRLDADD